MFIVCPSCSGPYRIAAEQIAPLVQTACPHCEYRVILDFEAANEPSLREAGHQFAQGFENAEAYASVYDHVTSKPDAQPRLGVSAVAASGTAATGTDNRGVASTAQASSNRPLVQPLRPISTPSAAAQPAPAASQAAGAGASQGGGVRTAGSKTVLQVPSKKPVSMAPTDSPSLSGDSPSLSGAGGSSMRAGKNVDVLDEPRAEEPSAARIPPHTPPTANVVSSGPVAAATPTTKADDAAAQSGAHVKPADTRAVEKPAEIRPADIKPPAPTASGSSMTMYLIIGLLLVAGVLIYVFVINK
jgi:DNA-directed RNA polymerase subunit RPC12/RpoP